MNGILLVDKSQDWTSSDVVAKLRGVLHERRIGHAGTLDPLATGLLVILVGKAARASDFVMAHDKEYLAVLRAGVTTDTQDITGTVLKTTECEILEEQVKTSAVKYTGNIQQIPPMYSAIKIRGKKLYEIARKGGEVERSPRNITVHSIELIGREDNDFSLKISCSSGTYIRTLCHDIGADLGCGACMSALRRVKVGDFSVENAHTVDQIEAAAAEGRVDEFLIPVDTVFAKYRSFTANERLEEKIRTGNPVSAGLTDGKYRVYSSKGEFLMFASSKNGELRTVKSFYES